MSFGMTISYTVSATHKGVRMACKPNHEPVETLPAAARDLVGSQTGTLLVLLGQLMTHSPALRPYIAPQTGEMLVKIGKKLTGNAG